MDDLRDRRGGGSHERDRDAHHEHRDAEASDPLDGHRDRQDDDRDLYAAFAELRARDQARAPGYDELLTRPAAAQAEGRQAMAPAVGVHTGRRTALVADGGADREPAGHQATSALGSRAAPRRTAARPAAARLPGPLPPLRLAALGLAAAAVLALVLVRNDRRDAEAFEAFLAQAVEETSLGSWRGPGDALLHFAGRELYHQIPTVADPAGLVAGLTSDDPNR